MMVIKDMYGGGTYYILLEREYNKIELEDEIFIDSLQISDTYKARILEDRDIRELILQGEKIRPLLSRSIKDLVVNYRDVLKQNPSLIKCERIRGGKSNSWIKFFGIKKQYFNSLDEVIKEFKVDNPSIRNIKIESLYGDISID